MTQPTATGALDRRVGYGLDALQTGARRRERRLWATQAVVTGLAGAGYNDLPTQRLVRGLKAGPALIRRLKSEPAQGRALPNERTTES